MTSDHDAPYPARLAFVVEFAAAAAQPPDGLRGRIEHVVTGDSVRFDTLAEFTRFVTSHGVPAAPPSAEG